MTNEDKIQELLLQLRHLVHTLTPQAEPYRVGDYTLTSSLIAAAEAIISGIVDERVLLALDMLVEVMQADLEDLPADTTPVEILPTTRMVLSA